MRCRHREITASKVYAKVAKYSTTTALIHAVLVIYAKEKITIDAWSTAVVTIVPVTAVPLTMQVN
jgi:hypothetical protein